MKKSMNWKVKTSDEMESLEGRKTTATTLPVTETDAEIKGETKMKVKGALAVEIVGIKNNPNELLRDDYCGQSSLY